VHDGYDYLRYANLQSVLDNLIHRLEIPPLIAALTQSSNRLEEYAGHDGHARFVAVELPEQLQHSFPLHSSPAARD
jgi:enterochelin esterase family protein